MFSHAHHLDGHIYEIHIKREYLFAKIEFFPV